MKLYTELIKKYSLKYKLDLEYFINNLFWNNIRIIFILILGFIFNLLLVKHLSESDLGLWYWFGSLFAQFSIFSILGYNNVGRNTLIEKNFGSIYSISIKRFIGTLIGSVILIFISIYSYLFYESLVKYFIVLSVIIHIYYLRFYIDYIYTKNDFKLMSIIGICDILITYVSSIIILYYTKNLFLTIINFYGSQLVFNIIMTTYFFQKIKKKEKINKKEDKLKLALKFSFSGIIPVISQNLDKVILPVYMSLGALGIYGIALMIPNMLNQVVQRLLTNLLFLKSTQISIKKLKNKIVKIIPIYTLLYICLVLILDILLKYLIINYWKIDEIILFYSRVLFIGIYFLILSTIIKEILIAKKYVNLITKIEFSISIIRIVGVFTVIPILGILGLIYLRISIDFVRFLLYYISTNKLK